MLNNKKNEKLPVNFFGRKIHVTRKTRKLIRAPLQYILDISFIKRCRDNFIYRFPAILMLFPQKHKVENYLLARIQKKKTIVLFRFPAWKLKYMQRFFNEKGCISYCNNLNHLSDHISEIILWGKPEYEEKIVNLCRASDIPLRFMEDGFIRSCQLGCEQTEPLSIVLDSRANHFESEKSSELESILNNISVDDEDCSKSILLMDIIRKAQISKYNLPGFWILPNELKLCKTKRILVIGQVEGDASITYGGIAGWTNNNLINLAVTENPDATIFYKPHPDVKLGHRFDTTEYECSVPNCNIINSEIPTSEILKHIDHVYVMTSLSGFEALIQGKSVTVIGSPFYSGWGLTDDRQFIKRRTAHLAINELFAGAYIKYPQYKTSSNGILGCLSSILSIAGEREFKKQEILTKEFISSQTKLLSQTEYWPVILKDPIGINVIDFEKIIKGYDSGYLKRILLALLIGRINLERFMERADIDVDYDWAFKIVKESSLRNLSEYKSLNLLKELYESWNYSKLYNECICLLLFGNLNGEVFRYLARIAASKMNFADAAEVMRIFNIMSPEWKSGTGLRFEASLQALAGNLGRSLTAMSYAVKISGEALIDAIALDTILQKKYGKLPFLEAMLLACDSKDIKSIIGQSRALIALNKPEQAEILLKSIKIPQRHQIKYGLALCLAYTHQNKHDHAKSHVVKLLRLFPKRQIFREALRIAVLKNDYLWGSEVLKAAKEKNINVGDMYLRKIALGNKNINESYISFRETPIHQTLSKVVGSKYLVSLDELNNTDKSVLVLAFYGPGDEIRFASLYRQISSHIGVRNVVFTCDPRLEKLFQRSYPELRFFGTHRVRELSWIGDYSNYSDLPHSELHKFIDNRGWSQIQDHDRIIPIGNILGDMLKDYSSFKGQKFLAPDPLLVEKWRGRLNRRSKKKLVGISWRSTLSGFNRNEHYLTPQLLKDLFSLEGIQFINLQYDKCDDELAWINQHFPGKIINFDDLDQFNDFDNVSALMSCLDLIISPATTVAELSGALGCPTLFITNSSEMHWRKIPASNIDVWQNSMIHIEPDNVGDKINLAKNIHEKVTLWLCKEAINKNSHLLV